MPRSTTRPGRGFGPTSLVRLAGLAAALVGLGCQEATAGLDCTRELGVTLTPEVRTLGVGQSFTPSVSLWSCGGRQRLTDTFTWSSSDPAIVSVEPQTGRVTAIAPGEAQAVPTGARYGQVGGVAVTVRAPE